MSRDHQEIIAWNECVWEISRPPRLQGIGSKKKDIRKIVPYDGSDFVSTDKKGKRRLEHDCLLMGLDEKSKPTNF